MNANATLPLCVDLDGTLIFTDALVEGAVRSFFRAPASTVGALAALRRGRAAFKASVLQHGSLDVAALPFNQPLLEQLRAERAAGRTLVLVTAANERIAAAVQEHLQLFDEVFASSQTHNLKGSAKSRFLVERYGDGGFVYVGDSGADHAVWRHAAAAWTVGDKGWRTAQRAAVAVERQFAGATATPGDWFQALGVGRWWWNLLLLVPLLAWPGAGSRALTAPFLGGLISFCLVASGMALFATFAGLERVGRRRAEDPDPVSAGRIALVRAGVVGSALVAIGLVTAAVISLPFVGVLITFVVASAAFTMLPAAPGVVAAVRRAALIALRPLAGLSLAGAGLAGPIWLGVGVVAALLTAAGVQTRGRAA